MVWAYPSVQELRANPVVAVISDELLEIEKQIRVVKVKIKEHDVAIPKLESGLRRLERRKLLQDAGVTDKEMNDLIATTVELDEKLKSESEHGVTSDIELDKVLRAERERQAREDTRSWTAAGSGKTIKATFAGRIRDKVKLKKEDGTTITVALDQLSEADQKWIEKLLKE